MSISELGTAGKPVIFLDIDGVVVTEDSLRGFGPNAADSSCVGYLNALVERADAEVVITSSWRTAHSLDFIREVLRGAGFRWPERVIDTTSHLFYKLDHGVAVGRAERRDEIQSWLEGHPRRSFVILDGDSDAGIDGHYVRTAPESGLGQEDVAGALAILTPSYGSSYPACT